MILKLKNTMQKSYFDLLKQEYLTGSLLVKMILNILIAIKMLKDRPLCIFLPKMSRYKYIKVNVCLFLIKYEKLLEKYNEIWKKVNNITNNEFDSNAVYNEKYIKTKIKSYNGKINTISTITKQQKKAIVHQ